MNIKKQIFRKRKREGKIRYMILRASQLRNQACDIGDFVMAMMRNGLVMGGGDGYSGLSGIQRERLVLDFQGFLFERQLGFNRNRVYDLYLVEKKRFIIIIYISITDVENYRSFKSFGYIYIYIYIDNKKISMYYYYCCC